MDHFYLAFSPLFSSTLLRFLSISVKVVHYLLLLVDRSSLPLIKQSAGNSDLVTF